MGLIALTFLTTLPFTQVIVIFFAAILFIGVGLAVTEAVGVGSATFVGEGEAVATGLVSKFTLIIGLEYVNPFTDNRSQPFCRTIVFEVIVEDPFALTISTVATSGKLLFPYKHFAAES